MRRTMHRIAFAFAAAAIVLALPAPATAVDGETKTCLKCRVKALVGAQTTGDIDRVLSYLAEDFKLFRQDTGEKLTREDLRPVLEWDRALHGKVLYEHQTWEGSTVHGIISETNDIYGILGLEPRRFQATFRFEDDLIREQRLEPDASGGPALEDALKPVLVWVSRTHAGALPEIYPDGHLAYNEATARRWIELLKEWKSDEGSRATVKAGADAS